MAITRAEAKKHEQAVKLLKKDVLTFDERLFVIENFHEAGDCNNKIASAHFTPYELANDFKLDVHGDKIVDLCTGIGVLAFAYLHGYHHRTQPELVCVELNPRYVEVGKKVLPEAEWICGDIFDPEIQDQLKARGFDTAISNPPFGNNAMKGREALHYHGNRFEYYVIDIASGIAEYGAFIIPQQSSPFRYSGCQYYQDLRNPKDRALSGSSDNLKKYGAFSKATGIELEIGAGIDTSVFADDWRGFSPAVEIVTAEFERAPVSENWPASEVVAASLPVATGTEQLDLF